MDFIENIQGLAARIEKQLGHLKTEEATKNALVMPFINALGYNVFDRPKSSRNSLPTLA